MKANSYNNLPMDFGNMLEQYRQFYPDAIMTEITSADGLGFVDEEVYDVVMKLCKTTHTMALFIKVSGNKITVIGSAEFLKNTDKMTKRGCKVRFCDPRLPTYEAEGEQATGSRRYRHDIRPVLETHGVIRHSQTILNKKDNERQ